MAGRTGMVVAAAIAVGASNGVEAADQTGVERNQVDQEIVVTAQRRDERQIEVPMSLSVVSARSLERAGISDTRDLQKIAPGLNLTFQGAFAQPTLRGITTTLSGPGTDSNVPIFIDGVYQTFRGTTFTLPDIERVEVLKGPQGTLLGRNSLGGAIRIFTRNPSFTAQGNLMATVGVYSGGGLSKGIKGFLSVPLSNKLAASISFSRDHDNGYMHNIFNDTDLGTNSVNIRGKLLYKPGINFQVIVAGFYSELNSESASAVQPLKNNTRAIRVDPNVILPNSPFDVNVNFLPNLQVRTRGGDIHAEWDTLNGTISSITSYIRAEILPSYRTDADASPLPISEVATPLLENTFQQEISYAGDISNDLNLVAGLYYYRDKTRLTVRLASGATASSSQVETESVAAFGELKYSPTGRLALIAGLRQSWERKTQDYGLLGAPLARIGQKSWSNISPRASLLYKISEKTNIYFTYSKGFKSGVFNSGSPTPAEPEDLSSYELGIKGSYRGFSFNIATFYYDYRDLQVQVLNPPLLTQVSNAKRSEILGLDISGSAKLIEGLEVSGGISYIPLAKYKEFPDAAVNLPTGLGGNMLARLDVAGNRMIRTGKVTGNFEALYTHRLPVGKLELSGNVYLSSSFPLELSGRIRQKAYTLIGSRITWLRDDPGLQISLWGKNLTNRKTVIGATILSAAADGVNYAPPLQAGITVRYAF